MEIWYRIVEFVLPFDWTRYDFMKNALLAILIVAPVFALLGTNVVNNRMAFFSDVVGHSALTGIGIGAILGAKDPTLSMLVFAVILAVGVSIFKWTTQAASDTVLGVFFAFCVALGVVLLSRGGGFAKFSTYLIGDILTVTPSQILWLAVIFFTVVCYWFIFGNHFALLSVNPSLARSRGVPIFFVETSFAVILAVIVTFSVRFVGILIINSLLILPAATARNFAANMRAYLLWAVFVSVFSGFCGLVVSYYWGTAAGATIALVMAVFYAVSVLARLLRYFLGVK
jgi:zinc transport system permease protein